MEALVFDSGPVISLALNNLLWLLKELRSHFKGSFFIPPEVKRELVVKPLAIRRFQFEAFQVLELINKGILITMDEQGLRGLAEELYELANNMFTARGHPITILHMGEIEVLALAKLLNADAVVIDERTTRLLIENPGSLQGILYSKLHTRIGVDRKALSRFVKRFGSMHVIRSVELVAVAYELGLLDRYIKGVHEVSNPQASVLGASLWALKLKGATVSQKEIKKIIKLLT